ncbi:MAG: hypothetical protein IK116_03185, partial [Firmicutes bacterium]|nr:hypothetical protein [Bacillota bacterium]
GNTAKDADGGGVYNANGATFNITGGSITGNEADRSGGGVYNESGATAKLTGGSISENSAGESGGGVYNESGATLTMTGGSISENTAGDSGGGICNAGTMTITGGSITGNTADGWHGGGVYNSGTLYLQGGSITGNEALGGNGSGQGGGILNNGHLYVEGMPVVSGNTGPDGNNIYMRNAHRFMTITGKLTTGASLYVTSARGTDTITSMFSDYNGMEQDPAEFFHSDSEDHYVVRDGLEAALVNNPVVTFAAGYETEETMDPVQLAPGSSYELPACGFAPPAGLKFTGWSVVIGGAAAVTRVPGDTRTVTADTTVTAIWENAWSCLQQEINAAANGAILTLDDTYPGIIMATENDSSLQIWGKTLTLDLNGHTLDRYGSYWEDQGISYHLIQDGEVIEVKEGANLTLRNGTLTNGKTDWSSGGGVYVEESVLTMSNVTVRNNFADGWGGGLYAINGAVVNLDGCRFENNSSLNAGGAVYVDEESEANIGNCTFVNNHVTDSTESGGAIAGGSGNGSAQGATIRLSGNISISGSTVNRQYNNLHLDGPIVLSIAGPLTNTVPIPVSTDAEISAGNPLVFTSGLSGKGTAENFVSVDD